MVTSRDDKTSPGEPGDALGPRGGRTTATKHRIRRTVFIDRDVDQRVRERAYETRQSEAAVIREALRVFFGIE
jgi:hypothetical protein